VRGLRRASSLTRAMSPYRFQPCCRPLVAYVALRCVHLRLMPGVDRGRMLLSGLGGSDSAVLKGAAASCRGLLPDVSAGQCIASALLLGARCVGLWLRCICASSPHLPPTSGQALCSMAGVYKFIMPLSGIRNRVRVRGFFHEPVRNRPLMRF